MPQTLKAKSTAPAVDRALDILEHLASSDEGLTLSQISAGLQMPKNAVFRITQSLLRRGYVRRDKASMKFQLTRRFLSLGLPNAGDISLAQAARKPMIQLRDATRETVQLGIRIGDEGVVIDQVESVHPLRITVDIGLRFQLHNNAPGKVLLAHLPRAQRDAMIEQMDLAAFTTRTIIDRTELQAECERVLGQGYATDYGEADEGIHCVAAPVFVPTGQLAATVWVSAPSRRMPKALFGDVAGQVTRAAREIGAILKQ